MPVIPTQLPFLLGLMIFWPVAQTLVSENFYCIQWPLLFMDVNIRIHSELDAWPDKPDQFLVFLSQDVPDRAKHPLFAPWPNRYRRIQGLSLVRIRIGRYIYSAHFPADIHYIDISKISEQPIPSVKAQFNYWFDKCAWHRPSILILDNLDNLLSAEVEVVSVFRRSPHVNNLLFFSMPTPSVHAILLRYFWPFIPHVLGLLL